jgi:hypothetical protein
MSRVVKPGTTTLPISNGETLTVRTRLNAGEHRASMSRMYLAGLDGRRHLDPMQTGLALITAYLLNWTVRDDDGAVIPISANKVPTIVEVEAAVNSLDPLDFTEIKEAIETHDETQAVARAEEKKLRGGGPPAKAISPSPSDATGASSGSVS